VATFFESADEFAAWLEKHGAEAPQLIVGFHKRGTQRKSMTWPESVDAALSAKVPEQQRGSYRRALASLAESRFLVAQ